MNNPIKQNAPKGATHYAEVLHRVHYIKVTNEGIFTEYKGMWCKLINSDDWIKPLIKPL